MDRFGEGKFSKSVFVIYSGIHYDAIALSPTCDSPFDFDQTIFDDNLDEIKSAVGKIAILWKKKHKYTDVASFTLKCGVCNTGIKVFRIDVRDRTRHRIMLLKRGTPHSKNIVESILT
jgi:ubiquitin thioesterase OTU1